MSPLWETASRNRCFTRPEGAERLTSAPGRGSRGRGRPASHPGRGRPAWRGRRSGSRRRRPDSGRPADSAPCSRPCTSNLAPDGPQARPVIGSPQVDVLLHRPGIFGLYHMGIVPLDTSSPRPSFLRFRLAAKLTHSGAVFHRTRCRWASAGPHISKFPVDFDFLLTSIRSCSPTSIFSISITASSRGGSSVPAVPGLCP